METPILMAFREKGNKVNASVDCPYCGQTHRHGWVEGSRSPHCKEHLLKEQTGNEYGLLVKKEFLPFYKTVQYIIKLPKE